MADYERCAAGELHVRDAPVAAGTIIRILPKGTPVWDVGDTRTDEYGRLWRYVALGPMGWVEDDALA